MNFQLAVWEVGDLVAELLIIHITGAAFNMCRSDDICTFPHRSNTLLHSLSVEVASNVNHLWKSISRDV